MEYQTDKDGWELAINAQHICPADRRTSYGISFNPAVSLINHRCNANAHVFFENAQCRVRTLRKIEAGTEITISYVDEWAPYLQRQKELTRVKFVECRCESGINSPSRAANHWLTLFNPG